MDLQQLPQLLDKWRLQQAQCAIQAQQRVNAQPAVMQQNAAPSISSLRQIILYNRQLNAIIQDAVKPPTPEPNAQPPRVTVQDIFDYHLLKDNCHYCQRPQYPCPVHTL